METASFIAGRTGTDEDGRQDLSRHPTLSGQDDVNKPN
jgi:hypothetical protein